MICKDSVICWFRNLNCDDRIDVMCLLLGCLNPFEVRFLGTFIEDLAKKDYTSLLRTEKEANLPTTYCTYRNVQEQSERSKLCVLLPLLRSDNRHSADALFEILTVHEFGSNTEDFIPDLCLLLTLSTNHPAFTFDQRLKMREKLKFFKESSTWPCSQDDIVENASTNFPSPLKDFVDDSLPSEVVNSKLVGVQEKCTDEEKKYMSPWKRKADVECLEEAVYIEDVRVVGSHVHFVGNRKEYTLEVKWSNNKTEKISKSFDELCEFHSKLVQTFSDEASKNGNHISIPSVPVDFIVKVSQTGEIEDKHLIEMEQFIRRLFSLPKHILRSHLINRFFQGNLCIAAKYSKNDECVNEQRGPLSSTSHDSTDKSCSFSTSSTRECNDSVEESPCIPSLGMIKPSYRKYSTTKPPPPVLSMYNPLLSSPPVPIPQDHHFSLRPTLALPLPLRPILFPSSNSMPQLQTSPLSPRHLSVPTSPNCLIQSSSSSSYSSPLQSPISSPLPSPILSPRGSPYASPFCSPRISPAHSPNFRRRSTGSVNYNTRNPPAWMSVYDWLKSLRLHKYSELFRGMSFREMLKLTDEHLQEMGMTIGATRKLRVNLEALRVRGFVGFNGFNVDTSCNSLGLDSANVHGLSLNLRKMSLSPTPSETDSSVSVNPCPNVTVSLCGEMTEEKRRSSSSISDSDMQSESGSQEGSVYEDDVFVASTSPFSKTTVPDMWSHINDRDRKDNSYTSGGQFINGFRVQCYNCGRHGHIGRQCDAPTMESSRASVGFHLRYNPSNENS